MLNDHKLSRRGFLVSSMAITGGFAISVVGANRRAAAQTPVASPVTGSMPINTTQSLDAGVASGNFPPLKRDQDFSIWLAILEDDTVIVRIPQPESGQGLMTQAVYNVAEELASDVAKMTPEFASPTTDWQGYNAYVDGDVTSAFFAGRSTVTNRRNGYFQAGASARERLKAAAAARWGISADKITVANSVLTNTKSGETLSYGQVAADAAKITLDKEPAIKDPSEWTLLGKGDFVKLNNELIVTGKATYGIDVTIDGMKFAAVAHCPVQGGTLKSFDFSKIKDMPGVIQAIEIKPTTKIDDKPPILALNGVMMEVTSAVAVVADHYWQAHQALAALPIEWDPGDGAKWTDSDAVRKSAFDRIGAGEVKPYMTLGDPDAALKAGTVFSQDYWTPYSEHSMMEPLNGTALVKDDSIEIWMPTAEALQGYSAVQQETGFEPDKIVWHTTYVGGSFGRRTGGDDARLVAAVAKAMPDVPVHVIWTREETFTNGRSRAAVATRAKAVLGDDGIPTVLSLESVAGNQAGWFASPLLQGNPIPNVSVGMAPINTHLLSGPYRGPGYNAAGFILDTFIDELSYEAGIDPLEYRIKLFEPYFDPGYVKALNVAADKIGWGAKLPKGEGLGVAIANWSADLTQKPPFLGSTCVTAAHVKVDKDGTLHVLRLEVVPELGTVINYDAAEHQIHGGTIFGLNMAMNEELTLDKGALVETNFDKYPMLRMADMPEINVHFDALTGDPRYSEAGEVPVGPVGPAIANAVFAAIGKRIRSMPFRNEDLSWS